MNEKNPHEYGDRYVRCANCGVCRPPDAVENSQCKDKDICARMKAHLEKAEAPR